MPAFTDNFNSVAAWALEAGSEAGHFTSDAGAPAGSPGGSNAGKILADNFVVGTFAYSRLDLTAGVPANTDWIVYAFYVDDWADLWMGGAGAGTYQRLPGHATTNDPDAQSGNGLCPIVKPTGAATGTLEGAFTGPVSVSAGAWHTIRLGTRIDGASSTEELWLDGVQVDTFAGNMGISTGSYGPMFWDEDAFYTSATVWIDDLTWSPAVDPGEPTGGGGNGGGIVVCGSGLTIHSYIDGTEVTGVAIAGAWTPRLDRPAQATITIPMDAAIGDAGSRLKLVLTDGALEEIIFHGFILNTETDTNKDSGTTVYTAQDPMELWQWRPVRDADGDFSKPSIVKDYITGPQIIEAALHHSIGDGDSTGSGPPTDAEGEIFLTMGTFAGGGASLTGAPTDWPMTIAELASLLISSGQLDLYITPTDPGGGIMGTIDGYNGDFGTDRSGSILFSYGMGAHNVDSLRWNRDMTNLVNKYWLYGGPRIKTAGDPAGDQHWCFNVTGQDLGLAYPPGGVSVDAFNAPVGPPWTDDQLGQRIYNSRVAGWGVRMKVDIFDAYDDNCVPGIGTPGRDLYRRQWQEFSWLSAYPREIIHITPTRDTEIGCFHVGDLVSVEATTDVRGGFSGVQRIYEYTISWDTDSVLTLSELQTSSDAEF